MKFKNQDIDEALKERESRIMDALHKAGEFKMNDDPDSPEFKLVLKKKKAASYIKDALKGEGLGDLAKSTRVARVTEES